MKCIFGQPIILCFSSRYIQLSLKNRTKEKWISGNQAIKYKVLSNSNIINKLLKQLLVHINTKQALTEYLADYTLNALKDTKSVAITFSKQTKTNIQGFNLDLANHDHEEANTLLVLHAINVGKSNPFQECIIVSPDTDVFLLLVHY